MLKKLGALALGLALLLAGCSKEKPTLEARWQFVGADGLRTATAPLGVRAMFAAPRAAEIGDRLVTNVTKEVGKWLSGGTMVDPAVDAALHPIVEDLLSHESKGEIWRASNGEREVVLAVKVTKERADIWVKAWSEAWSKASSKKRVISVSADRGWLFAVSDLDAGLLPGLKKEVLDTPPPHSLFSVEGALASVPKYKLEAINAKGKVKWAGHFAAPSLQIQKLPEWSVPTNIVRDPMIAFTALRGFSPLLFDQLGLSDLLPEEKPGQIFVWSQPEIPFQSGLAVEMTDPARFGARTANRLLPYFQGRPDGTHWNGQLFIDTNTFVIRMMDSLLAPALVPAKGEGKRFSILAFAPPPRSNSPPAPELLVELKKPGTVYYDWEITSENAEHWGGLLSSFDAIRTLIPPGSKSPGQQWLWGCSTNLGNTITRVTQTTPGEFDLVRNSDSGLSAMELVLFSRWVDPPQTIAERRRTHLIPAPHRPK
ncbi:MAG TPA: hypothetical protein VMF06_24375 [Candidatus Limnocylindria bacterium]|nr:hypothetical protein [Candidatus Limnocylindria bacterium]